MYEQGVTVMKLSSTVPQRAVTLSVIVPFYNEEQVLPVMHQRLTAVLEAMQLAQPELSAEIIYVDDGSSDGSRALVESFTHSSVALVYVALSRNFGKEAAMSAGLKHVSGEAVVLIDADLQDPPELIPEMLAQWREGYDVVNMQRSTRHGETWVKRASAASFYRVLNWLSDNHVPENVGDFRLLDREVVDQLNKMPEKTRYMKGMFTWPGFRQITVPFERDARFCGETKWNYFKLFGLAVDGITSFSIRPLRFASLLGALIAFGAFSYGLWLIVSTLLYGAEVAGYPSMMVVILALGGIQLLTVGVMGEYIGRIYIETKGRPLYIVQSVHVAPHMAHTGQRVSEQAPTSAVWLKESA
uniref:glycosyltransferase family 2 protein n=1 Tax=Thaumasiovibrio occultus TaxID=1891184 RepID=UPI0018649E8C|nr:glycosyltransferase family 2 protein [Thaumasiovibrio occultus]